MYLIRFQFSHCIGSEHVPVSPTLLNLNWFTFTPQWQPEITHHCPSTPFLLVGTQIDLRDDSTVVDRLQRNKQKPITVEQAEKLAKELKAVKYVECSALTQVSCQAVIGSCQQLPSHPPSCLEVHCLLLSVLSHSECSGLTQATYSGNGNVLPPSPSPVSCLLVPSSLASLILMFRCVSEPTMERSSGMGAGRYPLISVMEYVTL